ncbi:peptidoglycan-binding domain-containing protein [Pseudoduganella aquatica]|uniref:Peptidoglycan-binding domain-containing protein n=1 Tax=Pseudoduganella aquatica TaxID=2660641 RepID=A0A7X4HD61_9BURK|nr:peptidoglycan-binding domain-containing protein [Pseudoduganella aquatica]MYN09091.1 peptidoglycan-binding domain-containing protein [Pseudoduganella aquatica]
MATSKQNKELSGAQWARRFPGSRDTKDLNGTFRHAVEDFIHAMTEAGIKVEIDATYRPAKRSYLMHWAWRIANDKTDASSIPAMVGVDIEWQHPASAESMRAAKDMVDALSLRRLRTKPALRSQHNLGLAIDMSLTWRGAVSVKDANGKLVQIKSLPRNGMNRQLIEVGATYGVKKYAGSGRDVPHWSNNGR